MHTKGQYNRRIGQHDSFQYIIIRHTYEFLHVTLTNKSKKVYGRTKATLLIIQ